MSFYVVCLIKETQLLSGFLLHHHHYHHRQLFVGLGHFHFCAFTEIICIQIRTKCYGYNFCSLKETNEAQHILIKISHPRLACSRHFIPVCNGTSPVVNVHTYIFLHSHSHYSAQELLSMEQGTTPSTTHIVWDMYTSPHRAAMELESNLKTLVYCHPNSEDRVSHQMGLSKAPCSCISRSETANSSLWGRIQVGFCGRDCFHQEMWNLMWKNCLPVGQKTQLELCTWRAHCPRPNYHNK